MIVDPRARTKRSTVSKGLAAVMIQAMEAIDGDVEALVAAAGCSSRDQLLRQDEQGELTRDSFAHFAREAVLAFQAHACRRDALTSMPVGDFRLMCLAMLACPDLATAIEAARQFLKLTDKRKDLRVVLEEDHAIIWLDIGVRGRQWADLLLEIFGLLAFQRLFGWLIQKQIPIRKIMLAFPQDENFNIYKEFFQAHLAFDHKTSAFMFDRKYLSRPILRNYRDLECLFSLYPFDFLPPEYESQPVAERVRAITAAALSRSEKPPNMKQMAMIFGLSLGTFRRRLASEDTSLMAIRTMCRIEIADRLLSESGLSIKEIAFRAQFCNVSDFRRVFKARTGRSPRAARLAMRVAPASTARDVG